MPELSDTHLTQLLDDLAAMPVPSFLPLGARENGEPFIERHHVAGGATAYTVWHQDRPIAPNLDATYMAADEYLDHLDALGLPYLPPSAQSARPAR